MIIILGLLTNSIAKFCIGVVDKCDVSAPLHSIGIVI